MADSAAAWPLADAALTQEILDLVQQASHYRSVAMYHFTETTNSLTTGNSRKGRIRRQFCPASTHIECLFTDHLVQCQRSHEVTQSRYRRACRPRRRHKPASHPSPSSSALRRQEHQLHLFVRTFSLLLGSDVY